MTMIAKPRQRVTSAELVRNFGALSDAALTEPITITKNGRDRLVLLSEDEYQRLTHGERVARKTGDLNEDMVAIIEHTLMDHRHDHLNEDLKDWTP
jgi:prevent-host-death family protein